MPEEITAIVREKYGQTARAGLSSEDAGVAAVAEALATASNSSIPAASNMACPAATRSPGQPQEGETVVDLESGGGLDVFLAANKSARAGSHRHRYDPDALTWPDAMQQQVSMASLMKTLRLSQIDALPLPDQSRTSSSRTA